jgi:hypothetical protein
MNAPILNEETFTQEGYIVNAEGEILGIADLPKPAFEVTDEESAEWVLSKIADAEAEVLKLQVMLNSVAERLQSRMKDQHRRIEWLNARYGADIAEVAKANLPKGKKTWKGVNGQVAFRTTNPRLDIPKENTEKALGWLKDNGITQAIKVTESILKSEIPDDKTALLMEDAELRQIAGFELIPAGESVKIETVKAGKE